MSSLQVTWTTGRGPRPSMSTDTLDEECRFNRKQNKGHKRQDTEYFKQKYRTQTTLPMGHLMGLSSVSSELKILGAGTIMERSFTNGSWVTSALAVALQGCGSTVSAALSFVFWTSGEYEYGQRFMKKYRPRYFSYLESGKVLEAESAILARGPRTLVPQVARSHLDDHDPHCKCNYNGSPGLLPHCWGLSSLGCFFSVHQG